VSIQYDCGMVKRAKAVLREKKWFVLTFWNVSSSFVQWCINMKVYLEDK